MHERTSVVQARDLSGAHIGRIARLPGRLDRDWGVWIDTDAPITMITHKKDGRVKVRRHPDGHVDHEFAPDEVVTLVGGDA